MEAQQTTAQTPAAIQVPTGVGPEREQIVSFLLAQCDGYNRTIQAYQQQNAALGKQLADTQEELAKLKAPKVTES